jgi:hypothetical protein
MLYFLFDEFYGALRIELTSEFRSTLWVVFKIEWGSVLREELCSTQLIFEMPLLVILGYMFVIILKLLYEQRGW